MATQGYLMKKQSLHFVPKILFANLVLCLCISSSNVLARDISNEQRAASDARNRYNSAKSNDDNLGKQIAAQEKRVADEQARLKNLQDKQVEAKTELENAKADLDVKVNTLEKVWDERNKN